MKLCRTVILSLTMGLACTTAFAEEFRSVCPSTTNACSMSNTAISTNKAISLASATGAVVGDDILLIAYGVVGGGNAEKTRRFTVLSTPVTSSANLADSGYIVDITDNILPAPSLKGDGLGGDGWYYWLGPAVSVKWCSLRLNCGGPVPQPQP